jgi:uncharacterized protein (UPF0548 family)
MRAFLAAQRGARSTYAELPVARVARLLHVDRSVEVGTGASDFALGRAALARWAQYPSPWTTVISDHTPPEVGDATCARVAHVGIWSLLGCRVTRIDDESGRYAVTIETLESHAEIGAETFSLALGSDGSVQYRIESRSGARHALVRLGLPVMRHYQRRFLEESPRALRAAMRG